MLFQSVTPAKAGALITLKRLDSGLRRNDGDFDGTLRF